MENKSNELLNVGSTGRLTNNSVDENNNPSKFNKLFDKFQNKDFNGKVLILLTIIAVSSMVCATVSILTFINASAPRNVRVVNTPDVYVDNTVDVEVQNSVDVNLDEPVEVRGSVMTW